MPNQELMERRYDLSERLLEYAAGIIRLVEQLPRSPAGQHIAGQLLRSGTAPLPHHGEAQSAESSKDFVHKMSLGLKELREAQRWLQLALRVPLLTSEIVTPVLQETDELIRIFVSSIRTAKLKVTQGKGT